MHAYVGITIWNERLTYIFEKGSEVWKENCCGVEKVGMEKMGVNMFKVLCVCVRMKICKE